VLFGHIGPLPIFGGLDTSHGLWRVAHAAYVNSFSGPAAVIVFFVISGFCIHFPYRHEGIRRYPAWYLRRFARILLPLAGAAAIGRAVRVDLSNFNDFVFWSLTAEAIYYALYPLLMWLRTVLGWRRLLLAAFVAAYALVVLRPEHEYTGSYPAFGVGLNWVLGLPCWLLGCYLAERCDAMPAGRVRTIWAWRFGAWAASAVCMTLRFQGGLGYYWTLDLFAILIFCWLAREVRHFRAAPPLPWLEGAGKWSYSLYLGHVPATVLFGTLYAMAGAPLPAAAEWAARVGFVLAFCYAFYVVVEAPSHRLARWLGAAPRPAPAARTGGRPALAPVLMTRAAPE
jgi:peptidoglycan/LPS O-acetylase OafA/YrhL